MQCLPLQMQLTKLWSSTHYDKCILEIVNKLFFKNRVVYGKCLDNITG